MVMLLLEKDNRHCIQEELSGIKQPTAFRFRFATGPYLVLV